MASASSSAAAPPASTPPPTQPQTSSAQSPTLSLSAAAAAEAPAAAAAAGAARRCSCFGRRSLPQTAPTAARECLLGCSTGYSAERFALLSRNPPGVCRRPSLCLLGHTQAHIRTKTIAHTRLPPAAPTCSPTAMPRPSGPAYWTCLRTTGERSPPQMLQLLLASLSLEAGEAAAALYWGVLHFMSTPPQRPRQRTRHATHSSFYAHTNPNARPQGAHAGLPGPAPRRHRRPRVQTPPLCVLPDLQILAAGARLRPVSCRSPRPAPCALLAADYRPGSWFIDAYRHAFSSRRTAGSPTIHPQFKHNPNTIQTQSKPNSNTKHK